jgi:hypothetical protein
MRKGEESKSLKLWVLFFNNEYSEEKFLKFIEEKKEGVS